MTVSKSKKVFSRKIDSAENVTKLVQPILYFRMSHNTQCVPPKILHKLLFSNALGKMLCPQEHLKTIVYAKFGGGGGKKNVS